MLDFILASESSNGFFRFIITLNYLTNKTKPSKKKNTQINKKPPQTTQNPHIEQLRNLLGVHK